MTWVYLFAVAFMGALLGFVATFIAWMYDRDRWEHRVEYWRWQVHHPGQPNPYEDDK